MTGNNENRGRSRRSGVEDWGWLSTDRVLDDRVALCAVYTVHMETMSVSFLVEPQNRG
jgi:hypothetical protein